MSTDPRQLLHQQIKYLAVNDDVQILDEHEVYYDLGVSGLDLDELIYWIHDTFQVDFSAMQGRYAPGENELFPLIFASFGARPYKSMTVGHLLASIETGVWSEL